MLMFSKASFYMTRKTNLADQINCLCVHLKSHFLKLRKILLTTLNELVPLAKCLPSVVVTEFTDDRAVSPGCQDLSNT